MQKQLLGKQEWLRILTKGMVTIPKPWREELGLKKGEVILAKKTGNKIIIEGRKENAPYRIYTQKELQQFLKKDKLSSKLAKAIDRKIAKF